MGASKGIAGATSPSPTTFSVVLDGARGSETLINCINVDLLGLSPVHWPQRLKWATILVSTFCKISEEDCSRKCIKRPLFVLVSADLWWYRKCSPPRAIETRVPVR
jgi:hypothetical protein